MRIRKTTVRILAATLVLSMATLSGPAPALAGPAEDTRVLVAQDFASAKIWATQGGLASNRYPYYTEPWGAWVRVASGNWTSGFYPGSMWLEYQRTGASTWKKRAAKRQAAISKLKIRSTTGDVGFRFNESYVNAYRLTGTKAYRSVAVKAAKAQAKRYNSRAGMFRSQFVDSDVRVAIDDMMNLQLMFWAARNGGPKSLRSLAVNHALRARNDFVRPDGSTWHIVVYDPVTGAVKAKQTFQGYSDDSMWSRGQAWAIYGFTAAYRETRDARFLETARIVADRYLVELPPDFVPYWDFDAPDIPDAPRDTSAAAAAACGLIDLALIEPDAANAARYEAAARATIDSLASSYLSVGTPHKSVLQQGALNTPAGTADRGLVFGDYYFQEAMLKLRRLPCTDPALPIARVRAQSSARGTSAGRVLDGSLSTRWAGRRAGQWLELDLGSSRLVSKVGLAIHKGDSSAATFRVRVSDDRVSWRSVLVTMSSGQTGRLETFDFADTTARYVRIESRGTSKGRIMGVTEARVY